MIMRTLYLITFAGGLNAALVGGCGGKVIVDGMAGEGGKAGQGSSNSYVVGIGSGPTRCELPAPVGAVTLCGGGTSTTGSTSSDFCNVKLCDQSLNIYEAHCTDNICDCSFTSADGIQNLGCTCTLPSTCAINIPCCGFAQ